MKEAIQKAIEGGWEDYSVPHDDPFYPWERVWLDPLFWQALGKALGWEKGNGKYGKLPEFIWIAEWHRFIDHLAEGKDEESFFNELLK